MEIYTWPTNIEDAEKDDLLYLGAENLQYYTEELWIAKTKPIAVTIRICDYLSRIAKQAPHKPLHPTLRPSGYFHSGLDFMCCDAFFQRTDCDGFSILEQDWHAARGQSIINSFPPQYIIPPDCIVFNVEVQGAAYSAAAGQRDYNIIHTDELEYLDQYPEFVAFYLSAGPFADPSDEHLNKSRQLAAARFAARYNFDINLD